MSDADPYDAVITRLDEPAAPHDGPLSGRTLLVENLIDTAGVRSTDGSSIFAERVPGCSAPAVERLVAAGAVVLPAR